MLASLALGLCFAFPTPGRAEPHYLEAGIQNFNMNQFDAAMYEFKRAETVNPKDPMVHYYMGSALGRLNKPDEAYEEFKKALAFAAPNSQLSRLCKVALATYADAAANAKAPPLPPPPPPKAEKTTPFKPLDSDEALLQATGGLPAQPATGEPARKETLDAKDPLRQAVKSIHDQTDSHERAMLKNGRDQARGLLDAAEAECQKIQEHAQEKIEEMRKAVIKTNKGDYPIYSAEDFEDVKKKADAECEHIRRSAKLSAESSLKNVDEHALETEKAAKNLELQFKDQKITGSGVRIMPHGTNLYTRNYETYRSHDDERASIIPLIAKPQNLRDLDTAATSKKRSEASKNTTSP
jgi:hypothetical protein